MVEETEEKDWRTALQNRLFISDEYLEVVARELNRVLAAEMSGEVKVMGGGGEGWLVALVMDVGGLLVIDLGLLRLRWEEDCDSNPDSASWGDDRTFLTTDRIGKPRFLPVRINGGSFPIFLIPISDVYHRTCVCFLQTWFEGFGGFWRVFYASNVGGDQR